MSDVPAGLIVPRGGLINPPEWDVIYGKSGNHVDWLCADFRVPVGEKNVMKLCEMKRKYSPLLNEYFAVKSSINHVAPKFSD